MPKCKNHPDRSARRHCYQCKAPICPPCQIRREGHIFCSEPCRVECRWSERKHRLGIRLRKLQRQVDPRIWWRYPPFIRQAWARRVMVFFWILLFSQAATVGIVYMVAERMQELADQTVVSVEPKEKPPERQAPYWIDEPRSTDSGLTAKAAAGDESAVMLVDGVTKAFIPAGERKKITLSAAGRPHSWSLQSAELHREVERWTWGNGGQPGVTQISGSEGIAITFDGGWRADYATEILRTLREHGKQATFFLTGQFLKNHPDLTRRIVAAGHEVANHTWSHLHLTTFAENRRHQTRPEVDRQRLQWELLKTEQLYFRITGQPMAPLWRAPYGEVNEQIEEWAKELGYRHVGWTVRGSREESLDTLDWVFDPDDALFVTGEEMASRVVRLARSPEFSGGIVLMHLGGEERPDPVHRHLGAMIRELRKDGISTLTVGELLLSTGENGIPSHTNESSNRIP